MPFLGARVVAADVAFAAGTWEGARAAGGIRRAGIADAAFPRISALNVGRTMTLVGFWI